jgi:hypothetical protein
MARVSCRRDRARQRGDPSRTGAFSINELLDRSVSADMTTATAPRLPGDAYSGVQHRGFPHADHRLGGVGNTKVVAQPAVRAPAEQRPAPAQSGAPAFGQTHVDENGDEMTVSAPVAYTPGKYAVGGEGHRDDQERVGAAVTRPLPT